jgi:hypothetical protein
MIFELTNCHLQSQAMLRGAARESQGKYYVQEKEEDVLTQGSFCRDQTFKLDGCNEK